MPSSNLYNIQVTVEMQSKPATSPAAAAAQVIKDLSVDESKVTSVIAIRV
jgi:hypothetical protein